MELAVLLVGSWTSLPQTSGGCDELRCMAANSAAAKTPPIKPCSTATPDLVPATPLMLGIDLAGGNLRELCDVMALEVNVISCRALMALRTSALSWATSWCKVDTWESKRSKEGLYRPTIAPLPVVRAPQRNHDPDYKLRLEFYASCSFPLR